MEGSPISTGCWVCRLQLPAADKSSGVSRYSQEKQRCPSEVGMAAPNVLKSDRVPSEYPFEPSFYHVASCMPVGVLRDISRANTYSADQRILLYICHGRLLFGFSPTCGRCSLLVDCVGSFIFASSKGCINATQRRRDQKRRDSGTTSS